MKALIYSPYLSALGGGERYCLTVAEYLLKNNWQVDVFWDNYKEVERIGKKLDLDINKARIIKKKAEEFNAWQRTFLTIGYDLVFWLSDGSIPVLFGKKNILHFQRPFISVGGRSLFNQAKLKLVDEVVCNSRFTKKFIDKEYDLKSMVVYPPVEVSKFKKGKKENIILAVGRFEESLKAKRQDVMIEVFKGMVDKGLKGWQLVLIGGSLVEPSKNKFLKDLKESASGYPVKFLVDAPFEKVKSYYAKSKIFWHAAGFQVEESREPWLTEHFGITPVEAMAAGCVPVVIDKGGLKEIVRRGVGERWTAKAELTSKTLNLINNPSRWQKYSQNSILRSKKFSKDIFYTSLEKILKKD